MAKSAVASLLPKVNVSFSGCGFLGIYHVGSYACWKEHQERSLECINCAGKETKNEQSTSTENSNNSFHGDPPCFQINNALGASAGALVAVSLLVEYSPEALKTKFLEIAKDVKSMPFGPFNPRFNVNKMFRDELNKVLPEDIHSTLNGRLQVSLTDTSMHNSIQSEFSSKSDLVDALICSCYVPAFSSYEVPNYKGIPYLDGGFSNNQPVLDEKTTVRISPFSGASHICPDDVTPTERKLMLQKFSGETLEISFANLKRLKEAAVPPQNLESLYMAGYEHTDEFIRSGKIRDFLYKA